MKFTSSSTSDENIIYTYNDGKTRVEDDVKLSVKPCTEEEFYLSALSKALSEQSQETVAVLVGLQQTDQEKAQAVYNNIAALYIQKQLDDAVDCSLKGDMANAWNKFIGLANFTEEDMKAIKQGQENGKAVIYQEHFDAKFSNIEGMSTYMDFINQVSEFYNGRPIQNPYDFAKRITSYNEILSEDQQSQVFLSCARLFYPIDNNKARYPDYEHYLNKAIDISSSYEIIADCERYLEVVRGNEDNRSLKNAYKRVINRAQKDKDYKSIYGAATKLREIYIQNATKRIGYNIDHLKNRARLDKAIYYQKMAIAADKKLHGVESINELKELSRIYDKNTRSEDWIKCQRKIASLLKGRDRYKVLVDIFPKLDPEKQEGYLKNILRNISRDKMSKKDKMIMFEFIGTRAGTFVRDTGAKDRIGKYVENTRNLVKNGTVALRGPKQK